MEEPANFIPLGLGRGSERRASTSTSAKDRPTSISARPSILDGPKIIGATPAERKVIAREYRLAARRVKKKAKADAKRARKENAILHRRLTRNNEKYTKNKERNKERDIMLERQKIRFEAVRQAERLAAIHDPTGKMFNVGEVIIMPDGQVKSKEAIERAAEAKKQKEMDALAEKAENIRIAEEKANYKKEKLAAKREGREPPPRPDYAPKLALQSAASVYGNGGQPAYGGQQMRSNQQTGTNAKRKISKKQQQRLEMLKPKPVPPKPVIPEGIALPEGEENLLELWDITDEEIAKRLRSKKKEKIIAGKTLRKIQKEQKKFNRAMKVRKKQAANAGVIWDPEKAKKEILGEMEKADWGDEDSSDSESEFESDDDLEAEANGKNAGEEKEKPKKKKKKGMPKVNRPRLDLELLEQSAKIKQALEDKKRNARLKRRAERREKAAQEKAKREAEAEAARIEAEKAEQAEQASASEEKATKEKSSKKRKRSSEEEPEQKGKKTKTDDLDSEEEAKRKEKKRKRKEEKRKQKENVEKKKEKERQAEKELQAKYLASTAEVRSKVESKDDRLDREIAEREARLRAENQEAEESEEPQYTKVSQNWNPDALMGDKERREKFMKLLGAKKAKKGPKKTPNEKVETEKEKAAREKKEKLAVKVTQPNVVERKEKKAARRAARKAEEQAAAEAAAAAAKAEQIARMQSDLENQYEAGMKLKHDGGSKRRGLGA
ncbi:uncharacterized protein K444DRAFT_400753 [Hyaloscypha bicolor E]|uniref:Small acidic protein-like domain-containing protein n=1 Tax=Hyaloscypha bicolor E TaxID=1095630 RepID=A0A2J6T9Y3_9HELO|nr:uncharacterized protein K444DRAFT_400753 [Hyaloscypha bicolor E]PMD59808.1 hypothetical protein K444DRAFT_400753 [Hyaloscypha bicolor E]